MQSEKRKVSKKHPSLERTALAKVQLVAKACDKEPVDGEASNVMPLQNPTELGAMMETVTTG